MKIVANLTPEEEKELIARVERGEVRLLRRKIEGRAELLAVEVEAQTGGKEDVDQ